MEGPEVNRHMLKGRTAGVREQVEEVEERAVASIIIAVGDLWIQSCTVPVRLNRCLIGCRGYGSSSDAFPCPPTALLTVPRCAFALCTFIVYRRC